MSQQIQVSQPYQLETATPLGVSAVFNGPARDIGQTGSEATHAQARSVSVLFVASHASAANGAKIQMSDDAANWIDAAVGTLAAGAPQTLTATAVARYFRAQLTNSATAQTSLAIRSAIHRT